MMQKHNILTALLMLGTFLLHATHNRSGEIRFKKTAGLSVEATIVTYTRASAVSADRDSLILCWGDGVFETVARSNGSGALLGQDLKMNLYTSTHTYAAPGTYLLWMTDFNRTGNILNINYPDSDNVPFHLEASILLDESLVESSISPVFLDPPIDVAYAFQPFYSVPNAFDPDGDSLAYELVMPMADIGLAVPNYLFPDEVAPGDDNKVFFNPQTGEFLWKSPVQPGHYSIAILVKAYRNGLLVETTLRDMSIEVLPQANYPPEIALMPDIDPETIFDVYVGQTIEIAVTATDPDAGQTLTLSASGGPFADVFVEKANFASTGNSGLFSWKLQPEHVRTQPYQVVFKAKDNFLGNGLAATRIVRFRVREATGVQNQEPETLAIQISPNPASGIVSLQWAAPLDSRAVLQVFDNTGKQVFSAQLPPETEFHKLDLHRLPAGQYWIDIQTVSGKRLAGKLLKI